MLLVTERVHTSSRGHDDVIDTWPQIVLIDFDTRPRERDVVVQLWGDVSRPRDPEIMTLSDRHGKSSRRGGHMRGIVGVLSVCLAPAVPAGAAEKVYAVDPAASVMSITVGKAGLFKFAGHTHHVVAPVAEGRVVADADDVAASSVTLVFRSSDLQVTGKGEPAGDVPKVQDAMLGPKVLDAGRFPTIAFRSTAVSGRLAGTGAWDVEVRGDLTLHGVTRPVVLPLRVERAGDALVANGATTLKQRDYGIEPVSVAGVVKAKDELRLEFRITARPAP